MEKGVGTYVLNYILSDLKEYGSKLIEFFTKEEEMKLFGKHHGFRHYRGHKGDHFYKTL